MGTANLNPAAQKAILGKTVESGGLSSMLTKGAALAGLSGFLSSQYGMTEEQQAEALRDPEQLKSYLRIYYTNMNPNAGSKEIEEFVANNSAEYTAGLGGYAEGGKVDPSKNAEKAAGIEGLPLRQNQAGVKELDLRKTGGFIQPVGIKEKADDIESGGLSSMLTKGAALAGLSGFLSSQYGMTEEQQAEALRDPEQLKSYLRIYYTNMNPNAGSKEIEEFVANNSAEYTAGLGGYAEGGKVDPSKNAEKAAGIEGLPLRQNQAGVKELDLRKTGGFIQPVGIKEKADDIPAMLSNNEFVMTADAVKGAGGGDVRKGAQRMYDTMKRLEKRMA